MFLTSNGFAFWAKQNMIEILPYRQVQLSFHSVNSNDDGQKKYFSYYRTTFFLVHFEQTFFSYLYFIVL